MNVEEARKATLESLGLDDQREVSYIDEALLAEYENASQATPADAQDGDGAEAGRESAAAYAVYYGNHLVAGPTPGRLHFRNGTPTHPNDPCGGTYHRWVQMTPGSKVDPFRNCGSFNGFKITVF